MGICRQRKVEDYKRRIMMESRLKEMELENLRIRREITMKNT
jgi:hypothetical protein